MVGGIQGLSWTKVAQLELKPLCKFMGRFIHHDAEGMSRIVAEADAKKDARQAVISAIQELEKGGIHRSADLGFLNAIIRRVYDDSLYQEKLDSPLFRAALQDVAWTNSVGNAKVGILLKKRGGV